MSAAGFYHYIAADPIAVTGLSFLALMIACSAIAALARRL